MKKSSLYSNYIKKLNIKITKKLNKSFVSNDDLHDLFHYYDLLMYFDYYDNYDYYMHQVDKWKQEIMEEMHDL